MRTVMYREGGRSWISEEGVVRRSAAMYTGRLLLGNLGRVSTRVIYGMLHPWGRLEGVNARYEGTG